MERLCLAILLIANIGSQLVGALVCYSCDNMKSIMSCTSTAHCASGQSCFFNFSITGYRLGCIDNQDCGGLSNVPGSLVGRGLTYGVDRPISDIPDNGAVKRRDALNCFECCSSEICNKHLCEHLTPTDCLDDPKFDCALMNSKFRICQNIQEAKTVCPSFCGLCALVDGNWASWSAWSDCDVTCARGIQIRTRTCSNPTPVSGGLDCPGSANESKSCNLDPCPIDGNWEEWSTWSNCDVTCETGQQTRTRMCSNPSPNYNGNNCTGNSSEFKKCLKDLCPVHGGWTQWLPWEPCSVTCDFGIQRRHRNCTNPYPQRFGDHCFGDSMSDRICLTVPCANGEWSVWGAWSSCSATCGTGIKYQTRTCTNPRPSSLGRQCEGDAFQISSCNTNLCATPSIAFRAYNLQSLIVSSPATFVFTSVTLNAGNGYNNTTGIFTAPLAGTYSFSTQMCITGYSSDLVHFNIVHNGTPILKTFIRGNNIDVICNSANVVDVLDLNDRVWVEHTTGTGNLYQSSDYWNMFSGSLQHV